MAPYLLFNEATFGWWSLVARFYKRHNANIMHAGFKICLFLKWAQS